jgi:hypothetical protein
MSRFVILLAGLSLAAAATLPATAAEDCRAAVEAAFEKQRTTSPGYHVATEQFQDGGKIEITLDYQTPDRMYQKVVAPGERAPVETIAVARWAWGSMGGGWEELQPQFAQSVTSHVAETLQKPVKATSAFECLGKQTFEGKEYIAYRTGLAQQESNTAAAGGKGMPDIRRTVYVDPQTGLPALNVVAEEPGGKLWARTVFSYPKDLVVDAPAGAAPASRAR